MRQAERRDFLYVLIIFLLAGLPVAAVTFILYHIFSFLQVKIFMSDSDFLFIQSDYTLWTFIIFGFIFFMLVYLRFEYGSSFNIFIIRTHSFKLKPLFTSVTVLFLISSVFLLFSYTIVSVEGIKVKNNVMNYTEYEWNAAKEVEIYYSYVQQKTTVDKKLNYDIITGDGHRFNLVKSKMFWDKILEVNKEVRKHNVPIDAAIIKEELTKETSVLQKYKIEIPSNHKILVELVK